VGGRHNLHFDGGGFLYLVAVMDRVSRYVLAWRLSNLFDTSFRVDAVEEGATRDLQHRDQGSQFTDDDFTAVLHTHQLPAAWTCAGGQGQHLSERLSRSLKCEEVHLRAYESVAEPRKAISAYFEFYNTERLHQALDYRAPRQVFEKRVPLASSAPGETAVADHPPAQQ
jgi:putative transposase